MGAETTQTYPFKPATRSTFSAKHSGKKVSTKPKNQPQNLQVKQIKQKGQA